MAFVAGTFSVDSNAASARRLLFVTFDMSSCVRVRTCHVEPNLE